MERHYIAFISYRHLPLEMATAKKLHKRIEHYLIPKDLRKDGRKKLGYVFRDQDELTISSNLNDNIQQALDNSEFLIVICSPETVKSKWVLGEIDYFLEHHPRDHVLAVLTAGTPETAFPSQITSAEAPDGSGPVPVEPLAANLLASSNYKRARLFKTESLRILSALIGCPFDALFRREVKYRRRRASTVFCVAAVIATAFICLLLNRNREISLQLEQTKIRESRVLAALSEAAYKEGNVNGSLQLALQALPDSNNKRPYVAEAELALSKELNLYQQGVLSYARSFEQDSYIIRTSMTENGELYATADASGLIRLYDVETGELLWKAPSGWITILLFAEQDELLLASGPSGTTAYLTADGSYLWQMEWLDNLNFLALSADRQYLLASKYAEPAHTDTEYLYLIDVKTGEITKQIFLSSSTPRLCRAAAFNGDASCVALLLQDDTSENAVLVLCDFSSSSCIEQQYNLAYSAGTVAYRLLFTPGNDLILACDDINGNSLFIMLFDCRLDWQPRFCTEINRSSSIVPGSSDAIFASLGFLDAGERYIAVGSREELWMLSLVNGEISCWRTLPGSILSAKLYENEIIGLVLNNGTITFCTPDGVLTHTQNLLSFQCGYTLFAATMSKENVFAVIPDSSRQRTVIIRLTDSSSMFPLAALPEGTQRFVLLPSPSGSLLACLLYSPVNEAQAWILLDAESKSLSGFYPFPSEKLPNDPGRLCLTDDGQLTVAFEPDSTLPPLYENDPTVVKQLPICDGRYFVVFFNYGLIHICDISGNVLANYNTGLADFYSSSSAYHTDSIPTAVYHAAISKNGNRLLLFYDSLTSTEPLCIVFDMECWECVGVFNGPAAYLPEDDSVLVFQQFDGLYISPFWNREELIQKARDIITLS